MRTFEATLLLLMIFICAHIKNSIERPLITSEATSTTSMELSTNSKGDVLPNNDGINVDNEKERVVTFTSAPGLATLQGTSVVHRDNSMEHSTPSDPTLRQDFSKANGNTLNDTLSNDTSHQVNQQSYTPFKATSIPEGENDTITKENDGINSHIHQFEATKSQVSGHTSTINYNEDYDSSRGSIMNNNYPGAEEAVRKVLGRQYEQEGNSGLITEEKSEEENTASTRSFVLNKSRDDSSNTDSSDQITRAASGPLEEITTLEQTEAYSKRHNNYIEASTINYDRSDSDKSTYQSNINYGDFPLKDTTSLLEDQKQPAQSDEQGTLVHSNLKQTISSTWSSLSSANNNKANSTIKAAQVLQPGEPWTASQLTVGAFIGIMTVVMTIALFIVVLWRRRSYYNNAGNILHLQEFKTFHR